MNEYKIAILGSHDTILGFKGVGVEAFGLTEENSATRSREVLENQEYAIVLITENWAEKLENILEEYRDQALPAIVKVPPASGTTGAALKNLKRIVEQAIGSDILFQEN